MRLSRTYICGYGTITVTADGREELLEMVERMLETLGPVEILSVVDGENVAA